ncbi:MAG: hypothetical protein NC040_08370, partial [Muribaculaceae bacterium]|nr:hypothetical protein [Muribaculaceae bacterium]
LHTIFFLKEVRSMKITEKLKENYSSEIMLLSIACFLAGVVVGVLLAPVKKGFAICSYNGCNNKTKNYKNCNYGYDDEDDNIN